MKKFLLLLAALATFVSSSAQTINISDDSTVSHDVILDIEYQFKTFKSAKLSGSYGFGVNKTSFYKKNKFNIGANFHINYNAGLVEDYSMFLELGPSGRLDISKDCLINAPLNLSCQVFSYTDEHLDTKTKLYWGLRFAPSLYYFFSKKVGIFVGPQLFIPFYGDSEANIGMQTGVAISF